MIPWQRGHLFSATQPWVRHYQITNQAIASGDRRSLLTAWIDNSWRGR